MYQFDKRIVMTLDAGGTNFVFSAMQSNVEIVNPICLQSNAHDLEKCLQTLVEGFVQVKAQLNEEPIAISFAFPGPADYVNGIIGDLPNLKAFRGGVALGPFLKEKFGIPVFINNDGDLFAYGEAIAGILPEINHKLAEAGSSKRFKNLLGVTFGTGFGGGVVTNGKLHMGDNGAGGDVWVFRHKKYRNCITEESVGVAAIKRMYSEFSGDNDMEHSPKDICQIASGLKAGDKAAALRTFAELGEEAGDTIAHAITLIDGLVVIGGGLTGAAEFFMPALMSELNGTIGRLNGESFPRLQMKAFYLNDEQELEAFIKGSSTHVLVPGTDKMVNYNSEKRIGVAVSKLGASKAISLGAYAFALNEMDVAAEQII
ncbi:MAG: ROK family protein [Lentimicrobium sp.]|jgi:glucokinase|nr:ROK family protein [Lentimicrobium sp.]